MQVQKTRDTGPEMALRRLQYAFVASSEFAHSIMRHVSDHSRLCAKSLRRPTRVSRTANSRR
jgi:hypothetical protein